MKPIDDRARRCRLRGTRFLAWAVFTGIGLCSSVVRAGPELRLELPVEIDLELDATGQVIADEVEILDEPRSPKLRGPVTSFDPTTGELDVLGWTLVVDDATQFAPDRSKQDLVDGIMIEVKGRPLVDRRWKARSIEIDGVKSSWKIKGSITRVIGDAGKPEAVEVDGLRVEFTPGTDLVTLVDRVAEDLFRDLKEEEEIDTRSTGKRWAPGGVEISGSVRHHFRRERELDLGAGSERDLSEPSARVELLAEPVDGWKVFSQVRWIGRYALRDEGFVASRFDDEQIFELRQLYASGRDLGGQPLGVVVGKQRLQDDREFLFDEYLDAVRLYAYGLRPLVFEATWIRPVAPLSDKFEDWEDWLLQARAYPGERWRGRIYALLRRDSSSRGRDVRYYGVSASGDPGPLKTWLEWSLLRGEDKGQRQDAWAVDVGLALRAKSWPGRPGIWAGWAAGSGDDDPDDGVSRAYRQTGYEDNSDRIWGVASLRSYGELLDPELSNLRTWTVGVGFRPRRDLSVDLAVHGYALDETDDEFDRTDLLVEEEPLNGLHDGIGSEIDLVLGWRDVVENLHLVARFGRFDPGAAFGPRRDTAWLHLLEMRLDF